jgi:dihydrodipicolinate synthase/N-acetylneuraminate lyase
MQRDRLQRERLSGIWVPLPTPFAGDELALDRTPAIVEWLLARGIRGFLALGTTGEAPHLTDDESEQVVRAAVKAIAGRVPLLAGTGRASSHATVAISRRLVAAGADAVLVLTPFYYRGQMHPDVIVQFFHAVAGRLDVPVFVYHIPQVTDVALAPATLDAIVQHPNVWGFKDSAITDGPLVAVLQQVRNARQQAPLPVAFVGTSARAIAAFDAGAVGAILAVANVVPETAVALFDACRAGDRARAELLQARLAAVAHAFQGRAIAGVKLGLELRGLDAGTPRQPLQPAAPDVRAGLERAIEAALAAS